MKKNSLTAVKRKRYYKRAYIKIASFEEACICPAIESSLPLTLTKGRWNVSERSEFIFENFPEFLLLSPNKIKRPSQLKFSWFFRNLELELEPGKRNIRLTILAFCIAMCKDKK